MEDFLKKALTPKAALPPIPMRLDYPVNASEQEDPADSLPAIEEDDESPEALAAAEAQYKLKPGNAHAVVTPGERGPSVEDMNAAENSDVDSQIADMEAAGNKRLEQEFTDADTMQSPHEALGMPGDSQAQEILPQEKRMPAVAEVEQSPLARKQSLVSTYQQLINAQNANQGNMRNIGMLGGASKMAQGIATTQGGKIDANEAGMKQLLEQSAQPVSDIKDRIKLGGDEMNSPDSDISKFMREQAYAVLKKISPESDYAGKLEGMSAEMLKKIPGLGKALESKNAVEKAVGFGQFINGKTNEPLYFDQADKKVKNSITGEVVAPGTPIVRPIALANAFGGRDYVNPQGNIEVMSSKRANIAPEQMDKQAEVSGFKPDEKQREALDKEKGRVDGLTKNVNEKLGAASRILGALDGDSKQAMAVIKTQMPRLAGEVGNLNQSEQEVWQGSQGLLDKVYQYLVTKADSELTEDNKQELRKILGIFLKEAETSRTAIMDNSIQSLAEIHNIPPSFAKKVYPAIKSLNERQKQVVDGDIKTPDKSTSNSKPKEGMVRFIDSNGKSHDIPKDKLEAAKKRDPGLKVQE